MECDKWKSIRVLNKIQNLPQPLVDAINEWPNDNDIPLIVPKSLLVIHKGCQKNSKVYNGST
jgi:hypothetical protein